MNKTNLPDGLYDQLITDSIAGELARIGNADWRTVETLSPDQVAERLIEALGRQLTGALVGVGGAEGVRAERQLALINSLIAHLRQQSAALAEHLDRFAEPAQVLRALHRAIPATA